MISSDGQVLGVFDGVGGWAEDGVDPRDYPVALRDGCKLIAETVGPSLDPLNILRYGYRQSMSIMGSSTACIVTISNNVLLAANLGDSGLRVLRKGQVVLASAPQQHRFNTPFQLGPDSADTPEDAELLQFTLKDHDTIVLASDGLYDNLFDSEIAATVSRAGAAHGSAATLACALARGAYRRSKEACADNPFNAEARRYGLGFKDGKQDDITVLVAVYHGGEDDW
uniref:Protein phosphatase n=1 Tax=Arcella intermedia TaxID=1963864 RepID=A0A6B2LFZ3_9EUKA